MQIDRSRMWGYAAALASAAFVGLFTVLNKWLLVEDIPALTAGAWTYLAAGLALLPWALRAGKVSFSRPGVVLLWLFAGSLAGPSLYFLGLRLTSGVQGVLMINLEAVFTAFLAFAIFKETLTANTLWASAAIIAGGIALSWPSAGTSPFAGGALGNVLIALGYMGWGLENNLGRLLGEKAPPVSLVCIKALAAGIGMGGLAMAFGQPLVIPARVIPGILASGAISLGASLALFYWAMQRVGAARTGLLSSTSALWGVLAAIVLLNESLTAKSVIGGALMFLGVYGFARETAKSG